MEHGLARLVIGSPKFVPITEAEYHDIKKRKAIVVEALFIEEKFDLVIDNYLEFERNLLDLCAHQMVRGAQDWAAFQDQRSQINGRVVNLLSACRLYLDHTKHHLSNISSMATALAATIETAISAQYDGSFGYRLMEALRNYVQHRGYPIHGVTYTSRWVDERKKCMYAVTPYLTVAQLEEDGKFKTSVLNELKQLGEKVDIKQPLREYVDGLGNIHAEVRRQITSFVWESDKVIRDAIGRYRQAEPDEGSIIGLAAVRRDGKICSDAVPLFQDLLDYRQGFQRKNCSLNNLAKRHITSEIVAP